MTVEYIGSTIRRTGVIPEGCSIPDQIQWAISRDGVLTNIGDPVTTYTEDEETGERTYHDQSIEWVADGEYTEIAFFVVIGLGDESDISYPSDEFTIQKRIAVSSININQVTLNFSSAVDASGKTVTVDDVPATVNAEDATSITFTFPEALNITTRNYNVVVTLPDGSSQSFVIDYRWRLVQSSARTSVAIAVAVGKI